MAASAEVDALSALREAPGVSRCEVDLFLLRGRWQHYRANATPARTAAWFFSAHRPRPPLPTTNRSRVRAGTRTCDDRKRSAPWKCALKSRWQESCLSSAAHSSLRVLLRCLREARGSGDDETRKCFLACCKCVPVPRDQPEVLYVRWESSALSVAQATQMHLSPRTTTGERCSFANDGFWRTAGLGFAESLVVLSVEQEV